VFLLGYQETPRPLFIFEPNNPWVATQARFCVVEPVKGPLSHAPRPSPPTAGRQHRVWNHGHAAPAPCSLARSRTTKFRTCTPTPATRRCRWQQTSSGPGDERGGCRPAPSPCSRRFASNSGSIALGRPCATPRPRACTTACTSCPSACTALGAKQGGGGCRGWTGTGQQRRCRCGAACAGAHAGGMWCVASGPPLPHSYSHSHTHTCLAYVVLYILELDAHPRLTHTRTLALCASLLVFVGTFNLHSSVCCSCDRHEPTSCR
jgi:hypothetical protein